MEKDKKKIGSLLNNAGNVAKNLFDKSKDKALQVIEQNNDGKLDLADVSIVAESVNNAVKNSTQALKDNMAERTRLADLK